MSDIVTMRFNNKTAATYIPDCKDSVIVTELRAERSACPLIAKWYGGDHGGDDYTLEIDGKEQELDINGEMAL